MDKVKRVFICYPYRGVGSTEEERRHSRRRNLRLARTACLHAASEGCIPYAPHLYFPQFLMDADPDERKAGILMGLIWMKDCDEVWVIGRAVSEGMAREIRQAKDRGIPVKQFVPKRTPEERLLDAIFHPENEYSEMDI